MSIAREHALWLSFLDISGPFLSLPTLLRVFPQGLPAPDSEVTRELRLAYGEWLDAPRDPALHRAWVRFVLERTLEITPEAIAEGPGISEALKLSAPTGETLRPDLIVQAPGGTADRNQPRLLVHILPREQRLDKPLAGGRASESAMTRVMELLRATGVNLALLTNGEQWMLIASPKVSGGTTGFISWYASLWLEEPVTLRAFRALLGMSRFFGVADQETLEAMLTESADDQYELTDQLGKQVRHAVEVLVRAVDRENQNRRGKLLEGVGEAELYEAAVTLMMRLVFLFAAEERDLFSLKNPLYADNYAVSTLRLNLRETGDQYGEELLERRFDAWCRLLAAFRVVYGGVDYQDMQFRAYGGSLFDPDRYPFLEGRARDTSWRNTPADPLPITNRDVLYILESLQLLRVKLPGGGTEARRLSFRALDIEQIGDIYQTLLDHTAVRAQEPVLGLVGTKDKQPEVALAALEVQRARGEDALVEFLRDETGKSDKALRNLMSDEAVDEILRDGHYISRVQTACENNETLFARVLPFINLVRTDDFGTPVVILPQSVFVTTGMSRRQTQSHYTPRSLTEPLVKHTLEPLVYVGPAEGLPEAEWKLKSARELLQLKVCDMAMGSASILVQAVRYLGDRLVEAWGEAESEQSSAAGNQSILPRITPEGEVSRGLPGEELIPLEPEERQLFARRIVTARCIYGVDKNPLAVELAKMSLWLVTLDKQRAFTFLDHALKCGDSLVGADEDEFLRWAHSDKTSTMPLFDEQLRAQLETARAKRRELEAFDVRDVRDATRKQRLLDEANAALENIKLGCDILVGARLLKLKDKEREALLNRALLDYVAGKPLADPWTQRAFDAARKVRAFHWFAEFPEVFAQSGEQSKDERGGFDAFVGNPPFLGGRRIIRTLGEDYQQILLEFYQQESANADLCVYFFLRANQLTKDSGFWGLLSTKTIAEGDSRESGLMRLLSVGVSIFHADTDLPWPGIANVLICVLNMTKVKWNSTSSLNGKDVYRISSYLTEDVIDCEPHQLSCRRTQVYQGSIALANGFLLVEDEALNLIEANPENGQVVKKYMTGQTFCSDPFFKETGWVINFQDWPLEKAKLFTEPMDIVVHRVYPERMRDEKSRMTFAKMWWLFWRPRMELYRTISGLDRVLINARVAKHLAFDFLPTNIIFFNTLHIFPFSDYAHFALLQSNFHFVWTQTRASSVGVTTQYTPNDCFVTFPFPSSMELGLPSADLDQKGMVYHYARSALMSSQVLSLTETYNRFHNPKEKSADIQRLRELHVEMDDAVAAAYGWSDLELAHGFQETAQGIRFTISDEARREVLARLLRLNHERYEEEVRQGLHDKKGGGRKPKAGKAKGAGSEEGGTKKKGRKAKEAGGEYDVKLFE